MDHFAFFAANWCWNGGRRVYTFSHMHNKHDIWMIERERGRKKLFWKHFGRASIITIIAILYSLRVISSCFISYVSIIIMFGHRTVFFLYSSLFFIMVKHAKCTVTQDPHFPCAQKSPSIFFSMVFHFCFCWDFYELLVQIAGVEFHRFDLHGVFFLLLSHVDKFDINISSMI